MKIAQDYFNRGNSKIYTNDFMGAITDFDLAVSVNPKFAKAYNHRGLAKYYYNDQAGAIIAFTKANAVDSNYDYSIAYNKIDFAKKRNRYHVGDNAKLTDLIEINARISECCYARGIAKNTSKDYKGAITDFDKAIEIDSKYALAYYNRSLSKNYCQDHAGAITDFNIAMALKLEKVKNNIKAQFKVSLKLKNFSGAIADFDRAIEIDPTYSKAYYHRGIAKYDSRNHTGAITDFDMAIKIDPNFSKAYFYRGLAKYAFKNYVGAIADFDHANKLNPIDALAFYNRGICKIKLGLNDSGYFDLNKAGELGYAKAHEVRKN